MAAITNYHKFSGLNNRNLFWRSEILKSRCQWDCFSFGSPKGKPFPCLFQSLEATRIPWLVDPTSIFKASQAVSSIFLLDSDSPATFYKDPYEYIGPTQIIQDNLRILRLVISNINSICNFNSPLPCNQLQGLEQTSLRGHYSDYHSNKNVIIQHPRK